jgi:pyruvate/2-oxoglutarate dehydrogenase complex dihydrolipoamide dehydrogenase (E3) component
MATRFDCIIIGTGQAGTPLAARLAAAGMRVAVVERALFGGTCVNTGCIPTKAMVASAYAAHLARRAADYGVDVAGPVRVDMARVKARKDEISGVSRQAVERRVRGLERGAVFQGHARFESRTRVRVGDDTVLEADRIFINVGARAVVPAIPGVDEVPFLTNSGMMKVDFLPEHLLIVGGSYVGLEFAQMFRYFGSQVTLVEKGPRLISREDVDVSLTIHQILEERGVRIRLGAECIRIGQLPGGGVEIGLDCADPPHSLQGSHLLLAVGRRPNTDDLGLENAGIASDAHGYITVDDGLQTSVPGIYALGDCNGRGAFTHTSYNDYEIVADNLLDGASRRVTDRIVTYGLFIDPPLGRIGMTEAQVKATGRKALIGVRPMSQVGRAVEKGETDGFMKVLVDAQSRQVLGAAILGPGGDEAVHALTDLMYAKAPYDVARRAVHIHPTVAELIPTMLAELRPFPLN